MWASVCVGLRPGSRDLLRDPAWQCTGLRRELKIDQSTYFPKDQPWILRNLTTKEFVRAEAIALKPEFIDGPEIKRVGFGEVVMSRICWSKPSSSTGMDESIDIVRGVWAGHCFDITTLARHEEETKGGGGLERRQQTSCGRDCDYMGKRVRP